MASSDKRNALFMDVFSKNCLNENPRRRKVHRSLSNPIRPEMSMKQRIISQGDNAQAVWMLLLPFFEDAISDWILNVERRGQLKFLENRIRNFDHSTMRCIDPLFKERYLWAAEEKLDLEHGYLEDFQAHFSGVFNILFQEQFFALFPHLLYVEEDDEYHYY